MSGCSVPLLTVGTVGCAAAVWRPDGALSGEAQRPDFFRVCNPSRLDSLSLG